mmetsp:Transcript_34671/g.60428  ORF Transcript_34671/g.60428 Transcript_34671/m.60428 type:complete len:250 (+) Transcript_34671:126-875(+)
MSSSSSSSSTAAGFSSAFAAGASPPAAAAGPAAATGLAAAYASGSSKNAFTGSTSLNVKEMSATREATFLKAFPKACGMPASVGMPTSRLKAAMFATPPKNLPTSTDSLMSSTPAPNTAAFWYTIWTIIPYSNGLMPNFPSRIAALGDTLSPFVRILKELTNSICPLTIFVAMLSAWKKDVWDGSIPVGPDGMSRSHKDSCPDLAALGILYLPTVSRMSSSVQVLAKMNPMLPLMAARRESIPASGCCS